MKFIKATQMKIEKFSLKNNLPLKVHGREVVCVHSDTDS